MRTFENCFEKSTWTSKTKIESFKIVDRNFHTNRFDIIYFDRLFNPISNFIQPNNRTINRNNRIFKKIDF